MSALSESLALQIRVTGLPSPTAEYRFAPPRRWRFDLAWPDRRLAVEIEGGIWTGSRHTHPVGFNQDCDKYNAAVLGGWRVLRFSTNHIGDGSAISTILQAIEASP